MRPRSRAAVPSLPRGRTEPSLAHPAARRSSTRAASRSSPAASPLVALLFAGAISTADTKDRRTTLPSQVQSVSPKPGAIVPPQEQIVVDLRDDLTADLSLCGPQAAASPCPPTRSTFVPGLGQLTFQPGPGQESRPTTRARTGSGRYRSQADPIATTGIYSWSFVSKS